MAKPEEVFHRLLLSFEGVQYMSHANGINTYTIPPDIKNELIAMARLRGATVTIKEKDHGET